MQMRNSVRKYVAFRMSSICVMVDFGLFTCFSIRHKPLFLKPNEACNLCWHFSIKRYFANLAELPLKIFSAVLALEQVEKMDKTM